MSRLHFSTVTTGDAICPCCSAPIDGSMWIARAQLAFCPMCADSPQRSIIEARHRAIILSRQPRNGQHWHVCNGIHFWTPRPPIAGLTVWAASQTHAFDLGTEQGRALATSAVEDDAH